MGRTGGKSHSGGKSHGGGGGGGKMHAGGGKALAAGSKGQSARGVKSVGGRKPGQHSKKSSNKQDYSGGGVFVATNDESLHSRSQVFRTRCNLLDLMSHGSFILHGQLSRFKVFSAICSQ